MAQSEDFPRKRRKDPLEEVLKKASESRSRGTRTPEDTSPPEELVADARTRDREIELTAELELAREEEAEFESRYGMTFEEFQARFDRQAQTGEDIGEDYLAWSRATERVRMLRYELDRFTARRTRRSRKMGSGADDEAKPDRGRMA